MATTEPLGVAEGRVASSLAVEAGGLRQGKEGKRVSPEAAVYWEVQKQNLPSSSILFVLFS